MVADYFMATPSLAAQFIVDYNKRYIEEINNKKNNIKMNLLENINRNILILQKLDDKLNKSFDNMKQHFTNNIIEQINSIKLKYSVLENKINLEDEINIIVNGNKIDTPEQLLGNKAILQWRDKMWEITLKQI